MEEHASAHKITRWGSSNNKDNNQGNNKDNSQDSSKEESASNTGNLTGIDGDGGGNEGNEGADGADGGSNDDVRVEITNPMVARLAPQASSQLTETNGGKDATSIDAEL